MHHFPDWSKKVSILLFWLLLWQALALLIHNSILMVGPVETLRSLGAMLQTTMFWQSLAFSFVRIIAGFLIGSALGILLAWKLPLPLSRGTPRALHPRAEGRAGGELRHHPADLGG